MEKQRTTDTLLVTISKTISSIFTPFIIPFGAFFILFIFSYLRIMPSQYKLIVLGIIFCFTIMMPMFTIYLFRKINHITAEELGTRERRYFPYILTIISYVFCLFMMFRLSIPWYMTGIILTALFIMIIFFIANLKWRLSEHMGGVGAVIGGVVSFGVLFGYNPVWWIALFVLTGGLLGSARIISGNHTIGEVLFGFVIGLACAMLVLHPASNFYFRFFL